MDSLQNILQDRTPAEPPQLQALRDYLQKNYEQAIQVLVRRDHYLLNAPGAALSLRLRLDSHKIIAHCELDKRLVIHIAY